MEDEKDESVTAIKTSLNDKNVDSLNKENIDTSLIFVLAFMRWMDILPWMDEWIFSLTDQPTMDVPNFIMAVTPLRKGCVYFRNYDVRKPSVGKTGLCRKTPTKERYSQVGGGAPRVSSFLDRSLILSW